MAEKNSTLVKTSRYVAGGTSEVNRNAIEWWEKNTINRDPSDTSYVVEKRFEGRLDMIIAVNIGEQFSRYWWVVAMMNSVLDPFNEVKEGRVLYLPTKERLQSMLTGKMGGIPSTRQVPISILPIV